MSEVSLHPLLQYTQPTLLGHHCCPVRWDLRQPPPSSAQHNSSRDRLSALELSQHATVPPVPTLTVTCGIFPYHWPIEARNQHGVTILDVLEAIHSVVHSRLRQSEWEGLSPKQQGRVEKVFDERWNASADPLSVRANGVTRADCLLKFTMFCGLSESLDGEYTCILTLSRNTWPGDR